jgi:hypothetical protein
MANEATQQALKTDLDPFPKLSSIKTSDQAYSLLGDTLEQQRKLIPQSVQSQADVEREQAKSDLAAADAKFDEFKKNREIEEKKDLEIRQKLLPNPEFHPTQENVQSLAELFSMVATAGLLVGGRGKSSSINAMNAMGGILKGWQAGREDEFKKSKDTFDRELSRVKSANEIILKELEEAHRTAATDREASMQHAEAASRLAGTNSVIEKKISSGQILGAIDLSKKAGELLTTIATKLSASEAELKNRAFARETALLSIDRRSEATARRDALKGGDQPAMVYEYIGANLPPKQAEVVIKNAKNIGEAENLKQLVKENNGFVGREGQLNTFIQQYINSAKTGQPDPSFEGETDQDALIFAKRYAAFQVEYERALAGGARGFTVQFQNRWNKLTGLSQFNASGFEALMGDFQREMTAGAREVTLKANKSNLIELGQEISNVGGGDRNAPTPSSDKTITQEQLKKYAKEHYPNDTNALEKAEKILTGYGYKVLK